MWGPLFRRSHVALRRERVEMADGDFVDLDWGPESATTSAATPLVLVLHGLEGTSSSHYVVGLVRLIAARGWRPAVLYFRSCSGELNRLPRFYHSGDTADLDAVVCRLLEREPELRLGVIGVSLGGNVLLKWLGERDVDAPKQVAGAVAISVPFDLVHCARVLDRGFERAVYTTNFLRSLKDKVREKAKRYPGFVDVEAVLRARTFGEYDRTLTAPLHGFADEHDYWTRSSCGPYLARIRRPVLLINALDDPFVPPSALPDTRMLPPNVEAAFVATGGHCGFIEGRWPWRAESWAERRAVEFLAGALR
jgi:predicted alpha/beta-fold hydrolase